jgi:RecB family exonuclease
MQTQDPKPAPSLSRRTLLVPGKLSWQHERTRAARSGDSGLRILTLPHLAARLAGGFLEPVAPTTLRDLVAGALAAGGFSEIGSIAGLPGTVRAVAGTLTKAWHASLDLQARRAAHPRLADLALIERRVLASLPPGERPPRDLVLEALRRLDHASNILGPLEVRNLAGVAPCWRPLLIALCRHLPVTWHRVAGLDDDLSWLGSTVQCPAPATPAIPSRRAVLCADPRHEALEALRWARALLASARAAPGEIAIAAASPDAWDDHLRVLAEDAQLPVHFVHGRPALATPAGQQAAALAELVTRGLSKERVLRLYSLAHQSSDLLGALPEGWHRALPKEAPLLDVAAWQRAIDEAEELALPPQARAALSTVIELLAKGPEGAASAGNHLLAGQAAHLWTQALLEGPAEAVAASLAGLRLDDAREPTASILWGSAEQIATVARPLVRLLGLTSRAWPRAPREDPLLPEHLVPARDLEPLSPAERDRRALARILAHTTVEVVFSRSQRDAEGVRLAPSPLFPADLPAEPLARTRVPSHALSEGDRLLARPPELRATPQAASALACWRDWRKTELTPHDGLVRAKHPVILRALDRVHSPTSLKMLLRDPMGFVWKYALGWDEPTAQEAPLTLDPLSFGNLVHQILDQAVLLQEKDSGIGRSDELVRKKAIRAARRNVAKRWESERPLPPRLLWERHLDEAEELAATALSLDEDPLQGQRSWSEVFFGGPHQESEARSAPWDPNTPVQIPGLGVAIRGRIDRLDLGDKGRRARVTDYKTGALPEKYKDLALKGGSELQRCIYTIAVRALRPQVDEVEARLHYLKFDKGLLSLPDLDDAIETLAKYLRIAISSLRAGKMLPGADTPQSDLALALPAYAEEIYERRKYEARLKALKALAPLWEEP